MVERESPQQKRLALLDAAAKVFLQDEPLAVKIAGVSTTKFVIGARKAYHAVEDQIGAHLTDSELRWIHNRIRSLVITRGLGQRPAPTPS